MIIVEVPLFVITAKSGKGKKYHLNLNNYRNWHFQASNHIKHSFCNAQKSLLSTLKLTPPIELSFTLWKGSKRKIDRSNIISIIEKFFCDSLTHYGCIPDDNDDYIKSTHYFTGGIDRDNPRCVIKINDSS